LTCRRRSTAVVADLFARSCDEKRRRDEERDRGGGNCDKGCYLKRRGRWIGEKRGMCVREKKARGVDDARRLTTTTSVDLPMVDREAKEKEDDEFLRRVPKRRLPRHARSA